MMVLCALDRIISSIVLRKYSGNYYGFTDVMISHPVKSCTCMGCRIAPLMFYKNIPSKNHATMCKYCMHVSNNQPSV